MASGARHGLALAFFLFQKFKSAIFFSFLRELAIYTMLLCEMRCALYKMAPFSRQFYEHVSVLPFFDQFSTSFHHYL
jgi:hypothetical protein